MSKEKIFLLVFAALLAVGLALGGRFAWNNFRGAGPELKPPPQDIAERIEKQPQLSQENTDEEPLAPENTIGMPLLMPAEFSVSIFAKNLGPARVLAFDPSGTLLVSITKEDKVVALPDRDNDGIADRIVTVANNLNRPHGLAFDCERQCVLYIAQSHEVTAYDYDAQTMSIAGGEKIIDLPDRGSHFTRTIMFSPDGRLLVSVGSSCNVCNEQDWRRAKILVAKKDGSDFKIFAEGLRNAVFMATHPVTGRVWTTEMGRDFLGDDLPPDEINIIGEGKNYGWPFCYGKNQVDPFGGIAALCAAKAPSHIDIPAHSAPLGLAFIPEEGWPEEYWFNLLVAYHGSWNRSEPTGYKVVRYRLDAQGNFQGVEDFISGWLTPDGALGRPVDIVVQPGGVMYISDDKAGVIYRVIWRQGRGQ